MAMFAILGRAHNTNYEPCSGRPEAQKASNSVVRRFSFRRKRRLLYFFNLPHLSKRSAICAILVFRVPVELARREEATRRDDHLVQLVHHRGLANT